MKKFLTNLLVLTTLFLGSVIAIYNYPTGSVDNFYWRFTSPKQTSLILGTSRSAQGIVPYEINDILNDIDIYNYSFTIDLSPYGPTYLNSIKKKLNYENKKESIFIVSVDPWSISSTSQNPDDSTAFREMNGCLGIVNTVSTSPNYSYLLNCLDVRNIRLLLNSNTTKLHQNGWLEVNSNMNDEYLRKNIDKKVGLYEKRIRTYKFSSYRLHSLQKLVVFLKQYGKVYLVRLPVHEKMKILDDKLIPNFNSIIGDLAFDESVPYFNLMPMNGKFDYTDGNHLHSSSSRKVSRIIATLIKEDLGG